MSPLRCYAPFPAVPGHQYHGERLVQAQRRALIGFVKILLAQLPCDGDPVQAFGKDILKVVEARVLVDLVPHVLDDVLSLAPVTAGQRLAIGVAKALDEPTKETSYLLDRLSPALSLDHWRFSSIHSLKIAQEDRPSKERAAYRLARSDCPVIAGDSPLVRRWLPALSFPQNLQDGLGSGIASHHQLNSSLL